MLGDAEGGGDKSDESMWTRELIDWIWDLTQAGGGKRGCDCISSGDRLDQKRQAPARQPLDTGERAKQARIKAKAR